jgi:hypothetical protein
VLKVDNDGEIPTCDYVEDVEIIVSNSSLTVQNTYDAANNTSCVTRTTNALPQDTSTETSVICPAKGVFDVHFVKPQLAAGYYHTLGLGSIGTVVATGQNSDDQSEVTGWSDIAQVAAGNKHTVGVRKDGTVVAVGDNYLGQLNVGSWTDIVRVAGGAFHTVGQTNDGPVLAVGRYSYGQCDVSGWDLGAYDIAKYWTPERMRDAVPPPLGIPAE